MDQLGTLMCADHNVALTTNGFCDRCGFHPDMQSTYILKTTPKAYERFDTRTTFEDHKARAFQVQTPSLEDLEGIWIDHLQHPYNVIGTATHSETGEVLVIYKRFAYGDPKRFYAMPRLIFGGSIEYEGEEIQAFRRFDRDYSSKSLSGLQGEE